MAARASPDEIARRLCAIWAEALGVETVRADDDFFALGGTSVAAVQIATRVTAAFGVTLPAGTIFTERTVAAYAAAVAGGRRAAHERRPRRVDREALAPWEATVWAWCEYETNHAAHDVAAYALDGPLDVAALEWALTELVRRHEGLRTVYPKVAHRPRARVLAPEPLRLQPIDLSAPARARREQALRAELDRIRGDPIDYRAEPPLRVELLRLGANRHVLVLAMHELACDGRGYGVLVRDLSRLYDARVAGAPAALDPPALSHRDALHAARDVDAEAGRSHWEAVRAGAPLTLALPFDSGGCARPGANQSVAVPLARELVADLRALAAAEAATMFMAHGAAYALLLHRWSGASDIVIEASAENRTAPGLEDVVGLFARILPLRLDVGDRPSFRALLRRMRDVTLMAFHYADQLPVVRPLRLHSPAPGLMPALPALRYRDHTLSQVPRLAGLAVRELEDGPLTGPLHLEVLEGAGGGGGGDGAKVVLASTDAGWTRAGLARMAGDYAALLARAVADADRPIGELELGEEARLAAPRPPADDAAARPGCLHELVERAVADAPEAIAVRAGDAALSYRDLAAAADALAGRLSAAGVERGTHVGVALAPSIRHVVALLAVLRAGATCVPLPPSEIATELRQALPPLALLLVEDGRAPAGLVSDDRVLDVAAPDDRALDVAAADGRALDVAAADDRALDVAAASPPAHAPAPAPRVTADDIAFALPTAGVTGPPRCVALTHGALARLAVWQRSAFRLGPGDRALHAPGPGVRTWALAPWPYLAAGAEVLVPPPGDVAEPSPEATVMAGTPAQATRWLAAPRTRRPALRLVRAQGFGALAPPDGPGHEHVPAVVREHAVAEAGGVVVLERAQRTTSEWDGVAAASAGDVSVPVSVLDDDGRAVPSGAAGELALGAGAGAGFGAGAVRTGDLACLEPDGALRVLGRRADEATFRGFRMNPHMRSLEQVLARHPAIDAVAAAWDASSASLLACVVPRRGVLPSRYDLDRWVRDHVSPWVLPARYVAVAEIPRRADGSPDRRRLAELAGGTPDGRDAPSGATERTLHKLWRKVLGRRRIGVHENFFVLGGTLALGVELAGRAEDAGVGFSPNLLLAAPTIAELAAWIDAAHASARELAPHATAAGAVGARERP